MLGTTKKRALTTAGAVVGVVLLCGATASASIPSSNGTIYGCYAKSNGAARIIDPGTQKCTGTEKPISWSQRGPTGPRGPQGPKGDPGTPGTAGVSGYEIVEQDFNDVALPIDDLYYAMCPTGKHVLGGGGVVQLYNDAGFVDLGDAPRYSTPSSAGGEWNVYVKQAASGGATKANITVQAVCAVTGP